MALSRNYAKVCDLRDFGDPELAATMSEVAPAYSADRPHRKGWEFAMGALFLRDTGHVGGDSRIVDIGAGSEEILFWMASRAQRVTAIDIYGRGHFGEREATASFIDNPASFAPYEYPRERLEVRDMDARSLGFPDEAFDAVVSFSSIEHFGDVEDVKRSAREIGRVLRPGGHAFIVTEVITEHALIDRQPVLVAVRLLTGGRRCKTARLGGRTTIGELYTRRQIDRWLIEPSGLELMQPIDMSLLSDGKANAHVVEPDGSVSSATGEPYPHVLMRAHRSYFTSLCLPLVKPGA